MNRPSTPPGVTPPGGGFKPNKDGKDLNYPNIIQMLTPEEAERRRQQAKADRAQLREVQNKKFWKMKEGGLLRK